MIMKFEFTSKYRCFEVGEVFEFEPGVNLLVGDQGCGKSTLLGELRNCGMELKASDRAHRREKSGTVTTFGKSNAYAFDFEYDNPRTKGHFGDSINFQIGSMFASHGETGITVLRALKDAKSAIIFMDEPDMALSIRSILEIVKLFKDMAKRGNQLIAAVHNPLLIQSFDNVLSLEHRRWMPSDEFISSQSQPKT